MKNKKCLWILSFLILVMAALGGHHLLKGNRPLRPNVLWITMDSLRADHLGCSGYERAYTSSIDALAQEGALFTQSVSQATYTFVSVPSMITGKYPHALGIRTIGLDLDSSHVTLAEVLAAEEYFTYGILEPWPQGFYQGLEKSDKSNSSTLQKTRWCLKALDQLDDRPFFIWLYYWDPHAPYTPPVEHMRAYETDYNLVNGFRPYDQNFKDVTGLYGGATFVLSRINRGDITLTQAQRDHLINLYDAEISFVDSKITEVFNKIKNLGLWENTMVILNSDHGEAFGEHENYYHGHTIYEKQVQVPLIIKPPESLTVGKVIDGPVRNLDIMPTVLDYCDLAAPADIDGQSLRPYIEKNLSPNLPSCIETRSVQNGTHLVGYRTGGYKLIYSFSTDTAELFDLAADPQEKKNLLAPGAAAKAHLGPVAQLKTRLEKKLLESLSVEELHALRLGDEPVSIDPKTQERLKALGYVY